MDKDQQKVLHDSCMGLVGENVTKESAWLVYEQMQLMYVKGKEEGYKKGAEAALEALPTYRNHIKMTQGETEGWNDFRRIAYANIKNLIK